METRTHTYSRWHVVFEIIPKRVRDLQVRILPPSRNEKKYRFEGAFLHGNPSSKLTLPPLLWIIIHCIALSRLYAYVSSAHTQRRWTKTDNREYYATVFWLWTANLNCQNVETLSKNVLIKYKYTVKSRMSNINYVHAVQEISKLIKSPLSNYDLLVIAVISFVRDLILSPG